MNPYYIEKIIDRLAFISNELMAEFDDYSEWFWMHDNEVHEKTDRMDAIYAANNHLEKGELLSLMYKPGMGFKIEMKYINLARILKADPFVPVELRDEIVAFLWWHASTSMGVKQDYEEAYLQALIENRTLTIEDELSDKLQEAGCGLDQVLEKICEIQDKIREYCMSL